MAPSKSTPAKQVLVIDDEPDLRTLYELTLLREGYLVTAAGTLDEAHEALRGRRFDVVITDMRLPDGTGIEVLQTLRQEQRSERCIVITAYGSAENAVESLKAGAFDYLTKPVDLQQFRRAVASAIAADSASTNNPHESGTTPRPLAASMGAKPPVGKGAEALARIVGDSPPMRAVKERVLKVARSMAPVLVRGESGTGKELIANALHANSHRAQGPCIAVNCGAIPENLLEAEFFGVRKGAYTGATHDREGYFRAAHGGTLFLDEIGDLPLAMQTKLLRALQERCIRAVGATQEEPVDVRIISATHKDLAAEIAAGRFRQDLYYRLNVIDIAVPALRERREDLPALCDSLLQRIAHDAHAPTMRLSPRSLDLLAVHPLSGNVRELENLLHRAVALADSDVLEIESDLHLPPLSPSNWAALSGSDMPDEEASELADATPVAPMLGQETSNLQALLDQQERDILIRTLKDTHYNRTQAASRLGLNLRQIRYRIARLKIEVPPTSEGTPDDE